MQALEEICPLHGLEISLEMTPKSLGLEALQIHSTRVHQVLAMCWTVFAMRGENLANIVFDCRELTVNVKHIARGHVSRGLTISNSLERLQRPFLV